MEADVRESARCRRGQNTPRTVATESRMRSSIDRELHAQLHELAHALEHLVVSSTTLQHSHAVVQLKDEAAITDEGA